MLEFVWTRSLQESSSLVSFLVPGLVDFYPPGLEDERIWREEGRRTTIVHEESREVGGVMRERALGGERERGIRCEMGLGSWREEE